MVKVSLKMSSLNFFPIKIRNLNFSLIYKTVTTDSIKKFSSLNFNGKELFSEKFIHEETF